MARHSRLILAKNDILALFSESSQKIYSRAQLAALLLHNRHAWNLAKHTTSGDFVSFLIKEGDLRACEFHSKTYNRQITRYSWGSVSSLELAISIKSRAYLSHSTAVALHGLAKLSPEMIYLNVEQSPKPSGIGSLTQAGIDRAFSAKQRQSNLVYEHNDLSVTMIAGKNTNRLGVEELAGPASEIVPVTNLERTLIDIAVRPAYAGNPSQVLEAYRVAKHRMSVERLLFTLGKLDYIYPYHQSIGFLMEKAGCSKKSCDQLRTLGMYYDFYLVHGIQQPEYSKDWRLFYPKGLK